ncbi:MAG: hypothetical protein P4L84_32995 [Isosphaeraceae bacterium]|nr:hypothetical protein [Isosphaeraceae bacterium]
MAKTKGRPKKPGGEGTLVRIDSDIVSKARYLSARSGEPISEMFSKTLRPVIDKLWAQATREVLEAERQAAEDAKAVQQAEEIGGIFIDGQPKNRARSRPKQR